MATSPSVIAGSGWAWTGTGGTASTDSLATSTSNHPRTLHTASAVAELNPKLAKLHAAARASRSQSPSTGDYARSSKDGAPSTPLPIAGLSIRSVVAAIDFAMACVVFTPLVLVSRHWFGLDALLRPENFAGMDDVLGMVRGLVLMVLYLGWGMVGAAVFASLPMLSPGCRWMGMAVVDADTGLSPSGRQLMLRAVVALLDNVFLLSLGSFWMLVDARRQGLRDKVARTVVIRDPRRRRFP